MGQAVHEQIVQLAAELEALGRWMHVQLGQLEGVAQPVVALLKGQWPGDCLAPPTPGDAGVARAEADQSAIRIERAERTKAAIFSMAADRARETGYPGVA